MSRKDMPSDVFSGQPPESILEFRKRMEELRKRSGLTPPKFAKSLGIAYNTYRTVMGKNPNRSGSQGASFQTLHRIAAHLPSSELVWLLTGKEPPPTSPPELTIQSVPRFKRFAQDFAFEKYIPIKILGGAVAGGSPSEVREEDVKGWALIYASRDWMPTDPENYTCVHVRGKSMHPILTDGDIVAIDHAQKDPAELDGKMVAFRANGGATIKWLKYNQKEGIVLGVPENKDEIDHIVVLKGKEIDEGIVGLVRWWWAKR